jgi:hypothetical protein
VTPGARSTEFWVVLALLVVGAGLIAAGNVTEGVLMQTVLGAVYVHGRSRTKAPRPFADPPKRI